jgi:hypothetical protein
MQFNKSKDFVWSNVYELGIISPNLCALRASYSFTALLRTPPTAFFKAPLTNAHGPTSATFYPHSNFSFTLKMKKAEFSESR